MPPPPPPPSEETAADPGASSSHLSDQQPRFVVGINIGNANASLSLANKTDSHFPKAINKQTGGVLIPPVIGFTDEERCFSDTALSLLVTRSAHSFSSPFCFLGREFDEQLHSRENVSSILLPTISIDGSKKTTSLGLKIPHTVSSKRVLEKVQGPSETSSHFEMPVEVLVASILRKFESTILEDKVTQDHLSFSFSPSLLLTFHRIAQLAWEKSSHTQPTELETVVAVPPSFSLAQRAALIDSFRIANGCLRLSGLINSTTAAALSFCHSGVRSDSSVIKIVIIDSGLTETHVEALMLLSGSVLKVLHHESIAIGGLSLDLQVFGYFAEEIKKKIPSANFSDLKTQRKLLNAIEKTKKVLSTVNSTTLDVSIDGDDLQIVINRAQYESLLQNPLSQLKNFLSGFVDRVNLLDPGFLSSSAKDATATDLKIQIVGGNSRVPIVQSTIQEIFPSFELLKNIDGSTAVAQGAALYARTLASSQSEGYSIIVETDRESLNHLDVVEAKGAHLFYDQSAIQLYQQLECEFEREDRAHIQKKDLQNQFEQKIYLFQDFLNCNRVTGISDSGRDALSQHFSAAHEWLSSEDCLNASLDLLEIKLTDFVAQIADLSPPFYDFLKRDEEEKQRLSHERERAEKEAHQNQNKRDKTENPKTPKERVEAAKKRKDQGTQLFK